MEITSELELREKVKDCLRVFTCFSGEIGNGGLIIEDFNEQSVSAHFYISYVFLSSSFFVLLVFV